MNSNTQISASEAHAFSQIFWPELVERDGFILLAENYSPTYFDQVLAKYGVTKLEQTINTSYLDNLFVPDVDDAVLWEELGRILCAAWKARALAMFPDKEFATRFDWYSEDGDPGVVLWQPCLAAS